MQNRMIFIGLLSLVGCTSAPEYTWVKTGAASQGKEYVVADSACTAEAYKAAPITNDDACGDKRGFSRGACRGANAGRSKEAESLRSKVYDGCMLSKGWEKQYTK